jgi:hypothetical protein
MTFLSLLELDGRREAAGFLGRKRGLAIKAGKSAAAAVE